MRQDLATQAHIWVCAAAVLALLAIPTPAADAYVNLVTREWVTNATGRTGDDGLWQTPAFFGAYRITACSMEKTVKFTHAQKDITIDMSIPLSN